MGTQKYKKHEYISIIYKHGSRPTIGVQPLQQYGCYIQFLTHSYDYTNGKILTIILTWAIVLMRYKDKYFCITNACQMLLNLTMSHSIDISDLSNCSTVTTFLTWAIVPVSLHVTKIKWLRIMTWAIVPMRTMIVFKSMPSNYKTCMSRNCEIVLYCISRNDKRLTWAIVLMRMIYVYTKPRLYCWYGSTKYR